MGKIESSVLEEMKDLEKDLKKLKKSKHLTEEQIATCSETTNKMQACKDILEVLGEIKDMETPEERWSALKESRENKGHIINIGIQINKVMNDIRDEAPQVIVQR